MTVNVLLMVALGVFVVMYVARRKSGVSDDV
jgi:hypothetical protein